MEESINEITKVVEWYKTAKDASPMLLLEAMRKLTAHLFTLETLRGQFKQRYEQIIYDQVQQDTSVARATNIAEVEVPELYQLRRVMEASYRIADAIRTQISYIKHEQSHLKTEQ